MTTLTQSNRIPRTEPRPQRRYRWIVNPVDFCGEVELTTWDAAGKYWRKHVERYLTSSRIGYDDKGKAELIGLVMTRITEIGEEEQYLLGMGPWGISCNCPGCAHRGECKHRDFAKVAFPEMVEM